MAKLFRYLRWSALGLGILLLLLAVGLGIYSNTEGFHQIVREQLLAAINRSIRGSLTVERIEGSLWGAVTLHEVRLGYQDAAIARIPQLHLSYALLPLLSGRLQITRAEAAQPEVRLVRDRRGHWNIAEALGSDQATSSQLSMLLNSLVLRGGDLEIRLEGDAAQRYHLKQLTLASRLAIFPKGIEFDAGEVSARLESDKIPELGLKGSLAYHDAHSPPTIKVGDLRIETAASRLKLSGQLVGFDKSQINARLALDRLAAADVARLFPDWPIQKVVTGQIEAKGVFDALAVTAELAASGARLDSQLTVNLAAPTPSYRGTVKVAGFDPRALLGTKHLAGVLDGDAKLEGVGLEVARLAASGGFAVRGLLVKDWALGNLRLTAQLRDGVAGLNGALSGPAGNADWRGQVRLAKLPSYQFDLAVTQLDIQKLFADIQPPRGLISFKGKLQGSGVTPEQIKTEANLEVLPSTLGAVQLRAGEISAAYGDGRLRIARASLRSSDGTITVKGDLGTALDQRGNLDYEVRSENLTPWLALMGRKGAGALNLTGSAQGSFVDLSARGTVKTSCLQLDGISAGSGAIDFELTRKPGQAIPSGNLVARLADLRAGAELQKLDAKINLLSHRAIEIEARAQDGFSRVHSFKGNLDYGAPDKIARLQQLSLSLPDGSWNLAQPATLTQRGESLQVENLTLRNQERRATVDGQISLRGTQALNLTVERFPLEALAVFFPSQPKATGLMALQAQIGGSAAAPTISAAVKLADSTIGGQKYDGLTADLSYHEGQARMNLTVQQDRSHSLKATGNLPLRLSWQERWHSEVAGALDLRIQSAGLSLAFLNAYGTKTVGEIGGEVSLDVTARGALAEPRLSGAMRLTGGKLKLTALNVDVSEIATEASFDQQRLTIENFSARADDGRLTGNGVLTLKQYQVDNFKLSLAARRWPAIQTRRYQAEVGGNIELTGPLSAPKLAGRVDISEAQLRPDLAFLAQSSTPVNRDQTIVIVNRDGSPRQEPARSKPANGLNDSEWVTKLALDLDLRMPRNVWVRHPDAVAELRGNLRALKNSGQELQLVGTSEIVRGWAAFQGRRFDFIRGEIRFIGGGKVDPALDIVAQHRLPQYTVNALVGGTAENPSLVLRSEPALDQADILSLLVFGKTSKELSRGEQLSLKQNALDITSGFAAAKIGSAVAEAIGLDALGFDLGDFDFSGGRIGYGRYIGRRTYVTFSQELAGERGQKATVEYQISRDWKVESSTTSKGTSGVDVIWHKRY